MTGETLPEYLGDLKQQLIELAIQHKIICSIKDMSIEDIVKTYIHVIEGVHEMYDITYDDFEAGFIHAGKLEKEKIKAERARRNYENASKKNIKTQTKRF